MARIALGLEYDGRAFEGWQTQRHRRTVQDTLEDALAVIAARRVETVCAGRTDTGVHASAQVVHFDCDTERADNAWVRGVNAHLPGSIAVRWACRVNDTFHARFSARSRRYRYVLFNSPVRSALFDGKVGWYHAPLDLDAMQAGVAYLRGEHDFSAFRAAECQAKSPVRTLTEARVTGSGEWVFFDFEANAFLHHMIRNMVGALIYVGNGRLQPADIAHLLDQRDRRRSPPTFSPAGLYLSGVEYPDDWQLPGGGRIIAPLGPMLGPLVTP
ncbi:MAG: tRNA pseudouridine(38-40) synthase TruA [Rhodocyclaceae bacterium]